MKSTIDLAHEVWAMAQGPQPIDIATVAIAAQLDAFAECIRADERAECKPSLYLFFSENGGIRYWTRDAAAAARKAIEFGTEPERLYAATVPASAKNIPLSQHSKE